MRLAIAVLCAFLAACGGGGGSRTDPAPKDSSAPVYACDFEGTYCDFSEQSKLAASGGRRSAFVAQAISGAQAVRLTTLPGDSGVNGSGAWERNDLMKPPDASYCNEGQEEWWAISVLFPDDYVYPPGPDGGVVFDFHHTGSGGLPNFSIDTMPGSGMRSRGYGGAQVNGGQYGAQIADPFGASKDVMRNVWYNFVLHVRWSASSDGLMDGWLNGLPFQSHRGATLYAGMSCYLKLANYHGPYGRPSSIIFDRVIRATKASELGAH